MSSIIGVLTPLAYQELEHDEIFSEDQLVVGNELYVMQRERLTRATILDANEVFFALDIFDDEDNPRALKFHTRELPLLVPYRSDDEIAAASADTDGDNEDTAASASSINDTSNDAFNDTSKDNDIDNDEDIAALEDEPSTVDPLGEFVETDRLLECSTFSDAVWAVYYNEKQLKATVRYVGWVGSDENTAELSDKVDELDEMLVNLKVYGYNYAAAIERLRAMIDKL